MSAPRRALALLAAAIAAPSAARADPPIELTWLVQEGCPTREAVLERVAAGDLPPRPAGAPTPRVRAVTRGDDAGGWLLALTFQEPRTIEARTFEGASCATVSAAAVHAIRLALAVRPAPAPAPPVERVRAVARLSVGAGYGALPWVAPTAALTLGAAGARWRVEATVGGTLASGDALASGEALSARAWDLGVRGCLSLRAGAAELRPCAGVDGGFVSVTPANPQLAARDGFWVGGGVAAHATWWFAERFGVFAGARVGVNAAPATFTFRADGASTRGLAQPVAQASLDLGVEARLF